MASHPLFFGFYASMELLTSHLLHALQHSAYRENLAHSDFAFNVRDSTSWSHHGFLALAEKATIKCRRASSAADKRFALSVVLTMCAQESYNVICEHRRYTFSATFVVMQSSIR